MTPSTVVSAGTRTARDAVLAAHAAIAADGRAGIWIDVVDHELALRRAERIDERVRNGEQLPLAGTTLAVKGNIDVEGLDTTAGCPAYARRPERSAPVVRALVDAGTVVIGTTNMDQFATGLVGTRSPYGICPNARWDGLISGGSSSGSAVAVASGMVDLSLGTDTAGSGRVPAAANGIFGLKPTRGRLSLTGVVPACASLDCVSVFACDLALAATAARIAAATSDAADPWGRTPPPAAPTRTRTRTRIAVPRHESLDFDGDDAASTRHRRAIEALRAAPPDDVELVDLDDADLEHLIATGRLLYEGAFVAERYASVGAFVDAHLDQVDPVVASIISAAGQLPAWRLAADLGSLAGARRRAAATFGRADVIALPTVPRLPTVAQVQAAPVEVNSMLGTYTNFVNLLDLSAVTLPVGAAAPGHPPHSLSLIGPAWSDDLLVSLAGSIAGAHANHPTR